MPLSDHNTIKVSYIKVWYEMLMDALYAIDILLINKMKVMNGIIN